MPGLLLQVQMLVASVDAFWSTKALKFQH